MADGFRVVTTTGSRQPGRRAPGSMIGAVPYIFGVCRASALPGPVLVALLGDLTCQHDLGGLALAQGRDAVIVAVNNGGGGIFDHLPQAALPEFEHGWRTPQQIDFKHAALTFGMAYERASDCGIYRAALRQALAAGGPQLIELCLR